MKNVSVKFVDILAGALLLATALPATADVLWTRDGALGTNACARAVVNESAFKIVRDGEVAILDKSQTKDLLTARSLVQVLGVSADGSLETARVLSLGKGGSLKTSGDVFARRHALNSLNDEVLAVSSETARRRLRAAGVDAEVSYWQIVREGGALAALRCGQSTSSLFDVFVAGKKDPVARVAMDLSAGSIFAGARVLSPEEAEKAIAEQIEDTGETADETVEATTGGSSADRSSGAGSSTSKNGRAHGTGVFRDSGTTTGKKEKTALAEATETVTAAATSTGAANTSASTPATGTATATVPVIEGPLSFVVCVKESGLKVRDQKLAKQIFVANRFEEATPMQSFGAEKQKLVVDGKTYTFIQVKFPARAEGQNVGWVAEDFIKAKSECAGFQQASDVKQIICIASGSQNIRDEALKTVKFQADRFEDVALRSDWESAKKTTKIDGKSYEFVPVLFPQRNNVTGWVTRDVVKEKTKCEHLGAGGSTAAVSGGILQSGAFPTISRPTQSYFSGMRAFGARRGGGSRVHAAADLYRKHGEEAKSIGEGKIIQGPYMFYQGTFAIEVKYESGYVVRYGEVTGKAAPDVRAGAVIKRGQTVGYIGTVNSGCCEPMLHFEMYTGKKTGALTTRTNRYQRRSDLMNPSQYLRIWEKNKFGSSY